mgnify:CR=1 FL=1|jgi:hypothetical protein
MAEQKHTPGPWALAPYSDCDEVINVVAGYKDLGGGQSQAHWIAECEAGVDFGDDAEAIIATNEANARLIAAAPDLLAALKDIIEGVDECWMFDNPGSVDRAQAAIDKAEGR